MSRHSRTDITLTQDPAWWSRSDSRAVELLHRAGVGAMRRLPVPAPAIERYEAAIHRGATVECPLCGASFRHFRHRWNARNVICWSCGSQERHRALWLVLDRLRPELLDRATSLLHFAPEPVLERRLRARRGLRYVSGDLDPDVGELTLDITALDLEDASFDAVLCAHVLEHVPDDGRAMRELRRVLTPGGWAIVMVPMDHGLDRTLEDPSVTDPADRKRLFWQEDHVRLYGPDIADRLRESGFKEEVIRAWDLVGEQAAERYRLNWGDDVYLCRPAV